MKLLAIIMIMLAAFSIRVADPQTDSEHCNLSNNEPYEEVDECITSRDNDIEHLENQIEEFERNINMEAIRSQQEKSSHTLCLFRCVLLEKYPTLCLPESDMMGEHTVILPYSLPIRVYCDNKYAGSGWTIIQRRIDDNVNFNRKFNDYVQGFGATNGSFFIGLEKLHQLVSISQHELYIYLENLGGISRYAQYSHFKIGNSGARYKLESLGKYTGNAEDSLIEVKGKKFMPKNCNIFNYFACDDGDTPWWTNSDMKSAGYVK